METLNIYLYQMDIVWENPAQNRAKIELWLAGIGRKVDLVVLPEMFTTGFSMIPQGKAEKGGAETIGWLQKLAANYQITLTGSLIVEEDGHYYNRLVVVDASGLIYQYDKRHLFRMAGEDKVYAAGSEIGVFTLKGWRICPLICYDLRFPVWSRNRLKEEGKLQYDLLLYVANWPERRAHHWKSLLVARAIENQAWVAGVNRVGKDGNDIQYSGDSVVLDPLGVTVSAGSQQENTLFAALDPAALREYREKFPAWMDGDAFSL